MIREKLIFKVLRTSPATPSEIFGANYYDDWDFGNTGSITETASLIKYVDSLTGSGRQLFFPLTSEPTLVSGQINGYSVARFDGVNDFGYVVGSTAQYKFLHDGTGGVVIGIFKTTLANPNSLYVLASSTPLSSTSVGFSFSYDDRAASSRNDKLLNAVYTGASGLLAVANLSSDLVVTPQQFNSAVSVFDADNGTAADRSEIYPNNGTAEKNNALTNAPSTANSSSAFTVGSAGGASGFFFYGDLARIIVIDTLPTTQQLADLQTWLEYYYGTFPI